MEDGKRHEIPLRIRPVIGFNARILKIRNTLPCCWNTRRAEIFAYLCAVVDQWRRREEALLTLIKLRTEESTSYALRVQVEKRIGFWLAVFSPCERMSVRERREREVKGNDQGFIDDIRDIE